jgi:endonuclease/exonuclease/phosphatase family metal-dependent hydrolase
MTRFPLVRVVSHQTEHFFSDDGHGPFYYSRDCLEAHVDLGGNRELAVLVNHQISLLEDTNDFKRLAQAQHTRLIADGLRAATPWVAVLISGDMNSDPGTAPMNAYLADGAFVDFWNGIVSSSAYTYKDGSTYERFDYIMPDSRTAAWKTASNLVHGTAVTSASDHSPVVVSFTAP